MLAAERAALYPAGFWSSMARNLLVEGPQFSGHLERDAPTYRARLRKDPSRLTLVVCARDAVCAPEAILARLRSLFGSEFEAHSLHDCGHLGGPLVPNGGYLNLCLHSAGVALASWAVRE